MSARNVVIPPFNTAGPIEEIAPTDLSTLEPVTYIKIFYKKIEVLPVCMR